MKVLTRKDSGFSIIEVLVAIIILSVGLLALAQSSGTVSRMVGRGNQDTQAAMAAQARLDALRQLANTTTPKCTALANGSAAGTLPITATAWTVTTNSDGTRTVVVTVTYRISRGTRTETVQARLGCL